MFDAAEMLTTTEAAKLMRCSTKTIQKLCRSGALEHTKVGKRYLTDTNAIQRFLERHAA